jgi:hypothetical protein
MTLETLRRWAVPGALLMGGTWFASGIVAWVKPGGPGPEEPGGLSFYLVEGLHAFGGIGLLAVLVGLHLDQATRSGRLGSVGFWSAFVGTVLVLAATVLGMGSTALSGDYWVLAEILFALALLAWLVGFPLFGIATVRAKVFPAWVAILLLAWFPLILVFGLVVVSNVAVGFAAGLLWLAIGYGLWSHRSVPQYREAIA